MESDNSSGHRTVPPASVFTQSLSLSAKSTAYVYNAATLQVQPTQICLVKEYNKSTLYDPEFVRSVGRGDLLHLSNKVIDPRYLSDTRHFCNTHQVFLHQFWQR